MSKAGVICPPLMCATTCGLPLPEPPQNLRTDSDSLMGPNSHIFSFSHRYTKTEFKDGLQDGK